MLRYTWLTSLLIVAGVAAALVILAMLNPILGLIIAAVLVATLLLARLLGGGDGLDVEVLENGHEVVLVARSRYGLGLDIHTTDYGFLIRNVRGDSRKVKLGFHPVIVRKRFENGVMVLVCRKPGYT